MNIMAYTAKRALIDAVDSLLSDDDTQVAYAFPPEPMRQCVYGGALRFTQQDGVEEPGVITVETAVIDLYVRCMAPGSDMRAVDVLCENLADQITGYLSANPYLLNPPVGIIGVTTGIADPPIMTAGPDASVVSLLLLQVSCVGEF